MLNLPMVPLAEALVEAGFLLPWDATTDRRPVAQAIANMCDSFIARNA